VQDPDEEEDKNINGTKDLFIAEVHTLVNVLVHSMAFRVMKRCLEVQC
jgi:hypothetical protein